MVFGKKIWKLKGMVHFLRAITYHRSRRFDLLPWEANTLCHNLCKSSVVHEETGETTSLIKGS